MAAGGSGVDAAADSGPKAAADESAEACDERIARIRSWEDGPAPGMGGPGSWSFGPMSFPVVPTASSDDGQDWLDRGELVVLMRPASGFHHQNGVDVRMVVGAISDSEVRARARSMVARGRFDALYVAADAAAPAAMVEAIAAAVAPQTPVRLYVQFDDATQVENYLRAAPYTPPSAAAFLRQHADLRFTDPKFAIAMAVVAVGCPAVLDAFGLLEHSESGMIEVLRPLAAALQQCRCKMVNPALFELLIAYFTMPRSDLGWLPLPLSGGQLLQPLGLAADASVNDLVDALQRDPRP